MIYSEVCTGEPRVRVGPWMGNRTPAHRTIQNCSISFPDICPNNSARFPNHVWGHAQQDWQGSRQRDCQGDGLTHVDDDGGDGHCSAWLHIECAAAGTGSVHPTPIQVCCSFARDSMVGRWTHAGTRAGNHPQFKVTTSTTPQDLARS